MARFDNISDEMLAAFIDGNATFEESAYINSNINQDILLSEVIEATNDCIQFEANFDTSENNLILNELDIPELGLYSDDGDIAENHIFFTNHFMQSEINDNKKNLNYMSRATYNVYGESGENIKDPIFIQQPDDHSCALRSQQLILRDFGIDIPFSDLEQIALGADVYTEDGTRTCDIGKVLQIAGVDMHQVQGSTIYDLTNELSQGHRVIVSVDANELWYSDGIINKTTNWLSDVFGQQGGNHALIVAGVEVNPDIPDDVKVVLTDPGSGDFRIEYPLDQFMDAWEDSNCFMAATDNPAPFQYDVHTGMEVPSNFATQHFFNEFIANNSYQLSPDIINIPSDYQPYYNGHIEMVGNVDYDDFNDKYEELQCARNEGGSSHSIVAESFNSLITDLKELFSIHTDDFNDDDIKIFHGHHEVTYEDINSHSDANPPYDNPELHVDEVIHDDLDAPSDYCHPME